MRDERVLEMTTIAMFGAIIAVMTFVPWLGYISVGAAAITLVHIPVLIGGFFGGRRVAVALGLTFGVLSMFRAFMTPEGLNIFFQNPLVSVLPRLIFGLSVWAVYELLHKLFKQRFQGKEIIIIGVSFGLSTLIHTLVTLAALYVFAFQSQLFIDFFGEGTNVLAFIWLILGSNGFIEILLAIFVAAPIAWRIRDYNKSRQTE